ncbi:cellulose biosynthesis cyclic di-GMP-binding regulatory protein BcsB [Candidatus Enterovibrio escicola]|uniref:Cyclic di-GMP-binding protein n=1 Tax=Candidatus Enterovibrio escicola TaxID=1927127 RepID=A0A2A5SZE9_9GAMM|nr:cellulose biosynthesis cyclic di-GMP-binding regulatory protein BcsB [Candidatus Enterovibrio escacola]PCS21299.1 hypothetical protein BTN49_3189 [Candidatus Enterovibrio escacola]
MIKFMASLFLIIVCSVQAQKSVKVPLTYATDSKEDIVLRGQSQTVSMPISILEGQEVESVRLLLAIYNDNIIDRTVLWIAAGTRSLANVEMKQRSHYQYIEATIPPSLLSKQDPTLSFRIQHLSDDSRLVIDTTELNTIINVKESFYELNYVASDNTDNQTLSSFDKMVRSGQRHDDTIHLISISSENTDLSLSIAASLVQGWTLKSGSEEHVFDYRHISEYSKQLSLYQAPLSGTVIVYGVKDALVNAGWIDEATFDNISGPYIGMGNIVEGVEWVLVVSGKNDREVERASTIFANDISRLPERKFMVVIKDDDIVDYSLKSNSIYPLSDFTDQTELTDEPLELSLVMPSNILFSREDNAKINLLLTHSHVAPGAGSMILRVNGKYANSLPLRSSYWRDTQHYRLNIPMRDFKSGVNLVTVEVYGPVDILNQQRRFSVYMSDRSNLKLSSWVKFIPTEDHHVSPQDFLAIADDCGKQTQITVDINDSIQLANLWRLLSHVSHLTQKSIPCLMVTIDTKQHRTFHVSMKQIMLNKQHSAEPINRSQWASLKQKLFEFVVAPNDESHIDTDMPFDNQIHTIANVIHTNEKGWYRIQFTEVNQEKFNEFLRSEAHSPPAGVLSERDFSSSTSQVIKAAFIGYPAGLSIIALIIIWWLSAIVSRSLEARK